MYEVNYLYIKNRLSNFHINNKSNIRKDKYKFFMKMLFS